MSHRLGSLLVWLLGGVIAALACSLTFSAAHVGNEYVPVGNDSFYHARRILDTARDPASFYEFDAKIHAPEGSLLTWPWGYDYALAMLVKAGTAIGLSDDPMAILTWIPVAAVFVNLGLLVLLARRLQLTTWPTAIAALCMALAPMTQLLHGPGELDHHYAELTFLLASLSAGVFWLQNPSSRRRAIALGVVLGVAPAIHNGLFILQVPLLVALFGWWLQQRRLAPEVALAFAIALLASSVAVLLPSLPFREGRFEFYLLCWFHLYVAACSAIIVTLLSRLSYSRKTLLILVLAAAVLSIPLLGQLHLARTFVGGTNDYLAAIEEMHSPLSVARKQGLLWLTKIYSALVLLAPVTFVLCLWQCWRERGSDRLLFWITSALGLALLAAQQRMHYFGGFALYLPWLVLATDAARRRPELSKQIFLGATAAAALMYAPVLRYQLFEAMPLANEAYFEGVRPLYLTLRKECEREPGIVLADSNAGHPIRFYTECSVIANNFLLTPQHFAKLDQADALFALSSAELARQRPAIRYLLIRARAIRQLPDGSVQYQLFFSRTGPLANELLFSDPSALPPGYTLLQEMNFGGKAPYARLFRIDGVTQQSSSPQR